jgi:superfamily II DNA or RNA helicase
MKPDVWAGRTPRRWQGEAFDVVLAKLRAGVRRPLVHACTGSGKSRLLGALAAACTGSVLVTTPTQALVDQLAETISEHCVAERVGRCYQHAWQPDRDVVVTCIPSLPALLEQRPSWGCWLADEAHRLEGPSTREVRERLEARVAVGFTATPYTATGRGLVLWDELAYSYTSYQATLDGVLVPLRVERSATGGDVDELTAEWVSRATGPGIVSATSVDDARAYARRIGGLEIHGYLPRCEREARIEALRQGQVPALVHVQLLVEGVDLPWLRWIAIRRPVSSPTRLVQEVGRILRASPGKTEAVVWDPHDCLGSVGLVHGAQLEDVQRRAAPASEEDPWEIPELPGLAELAGLPRARAISALEGWATDALGALRAAGVAAPPEPTGPNPSGPWRRKAASDKQRAAAQRWVHASRHLPTDAHRAVVDLLLGDARLRAGVASDVLGILLAFGRKTRKAGRVALPPIRALEAA